MPTTTAAVATEHASRYLQQLCKHWSHKFSVEFDPAQGAIDFGQGQSVALSATPASLTVTVTDANGDSAVDDLERVVEDHIKRFAFRETLVFDWSRLES